MDFELLELLEVMAVVVMVLLLLLRGRIEPVERVVGEGRAQLLVAQVLQLELLQLLVVVVGCREQVVVMVAVVMVAVVVVLALGAQVYGQIAGSSHFHFLSYFFLLID